MTINIGSSSINSIYVGDTAVKSVYLGDNLVYSKQTEPSTEIDKSYNYFVFDTTKVSGVESSAAKNIGFLGYRAGDETTWNALTDWGDGTINTELTHQYAKGGIYTVKTKWAINGNSSGSSSDNTLYTGYKLIRCENINKNITNIDCFFSGCENLTYINTNFDSSKLTSMKQTFSSCLSLTSLDLSSWNVDNVTDMTSMFLFCKQLTSLNISGWNMNNVKNKTRMFYKHNSNLTIDRITMTGCNDVTRTKIQEALNA